MAQVGGPQFQARQQRRQQGLWQQGAPQQGQAISSRPAQQPSQAPQQGGSRLQALARYGQAGQQLGLSRGQMQGTLNRRFGQDQGMGEGYRPPRRSYGGQHQGAYERQQNYGRGFSPRAAGAMYGGRPSQGGSAWGQQHRGGYQGQWGQGGYGRGFNPPQQFNYGYPTGGQAIQYGGYQQQMPQWGNQTNALTGYGQNPISYVQQPYGGRNAVPRHPSFGMQQNRWNILGGG